MLKPLADLLSLIMWPLFDLTHNWWVTILLFTVVIKAILMPLSLWVQKNSIQMVKIMPAINRIKVRHFGDSETIGEKQNALYKEYGYHPMLSLVPLAVQVLILFGLVDVIHMITDSGSPGTEFLGMVPTEDGGASWVMPILAGLSAVLLGFAQNRINPLQREQSRAEKNMTNGLSIALSLFLGVFVAAGMAFYWICSNVTAIAIQALCNIIIKPKKYIDYKELEESRLELDELNKLEDTKSKWWKKNPLAKREKEDYKRFFSIVGKHVVFYSEGSGFYKYFRGAIEYMLANSNIFIHYVTLDPNDQIFDIAKDEPRILPYYVSEKRAITLFMKMDADIVCLSTEDIDNYYLKRSYVKKDTQYVFMFHHMTSTHLTALKESYKNYDALLCTGPHMVNELRMAEKIYHLPKKELIECGYDLLDREIADFEASRANIEHLSSDNDSHSAKPSILIAPSWQQDNLLDLCVDELLEGLAGNGWNIIVRPHPEYKKRYSIRWEAIVKRYEGNPDIVFERDFSSNETIFNSDVLITDWSSIFCEFCFTTKRPAIFIDTPMKIGNPDWEELGLPATDITLRNEVGTSIAVEEVREKVAAVVQEMLNNPSAWNDRIESIRNNFVFNLGNGGKVAGEFVLNRVLEMQEKNAVCN